MALRAYTQDEIFNSSIGDDVYLQPDVDRELETFRNSAHTLAEINKRLTEEGIRLIEEAEKKDKVIADLKSKLQALTGDN